LLLLASEAAKALVLVFMMKRNQKTTAAPALRYISKSNCWLMTATVVKQNDCCGDLELLAFGLLVLLFVLGYEKKQVKSTVCNDGYDHTNMTAPLPVCSAKLSMFGPG
jgi:hypothetical protein